MDCSPFTLSILPPSRLPVPPLQAQPHLLCSLTDRMKEWQPHAKSGQVPGPGQLRGEGGRQMGTLIRCAEQAALPRTCRSSGQDRPCFSVHFMPSGSTASRVSRVSLHAAQPQAAAEELHYILGAAMVCWSC